jgi:hypothetical protein
LANLATAVNVPAFVVCTVQINVAVIPEGTGPDVLAQAIAPAVPPIVQVTVPFGATAFTEPVTVAVKVTIPPRVNVPDGVTTMVGVAAATTVVVEDGVAGTAK